MFQLRHITRPLLAAALLGSLGLGQGLVDFETVPGGAPVDQMAISNQYQASNGIRFHLEGGGFPQLAQVGAPLTAFEGDLLLEDQPAPGAGAGQFFLTDDASVFGQPANLIVTYSAPVSAASARILDIDHLEEFTVESFDLAGNLLDTQVFGLNPVDGGATTWSFAPGFPVIARVRFTHTGLDTNGVVGFAFDRFNSGGVTGAGQANSPQASLVVNDIGATGTAGPFGVAVTGGTLTLEWQGPPNRPLILLAGPANPANTVIACIGSVDIGTPPFFPNVVVVFDGTLFPGSLFYRLDAAGSAKQTYSLNLPPGPVTTFQGLVIQPPGAPCSAVLTAAHQVVIF